MSTKPIDLFIRKEQSSVRTSLNTAFDMGWVACEERIVALLEEDTKAKDCWQRDEQRIYWKAIRRAIALIKGEQK